MIKYFIISSRLKCKGNQTPQNDNEQHQTYENIRRLDKSVYVPQFYTFGLGLFIKYPKFDFIFHQYLKSHRKHESQNSSEQDQAYESPQGFEYETPEHTPGYGRWNAYII